MRRLIALTLLLFSPLAAAHESVWTMDALEPSSIVQGCVNAITGDYVESSEDLAVRSIAPLSIRRSLVSSDTTGYRFANGAMIYEREAQWINANIHGHGRHPNTCCIKMHHPSGGRLLYLPTSQPHQRWVLCTDKSFCNTGCGELSGRTNPMGTSITLERAPSRLVMKRPDGEEATYDFGHISDEKRFYTESSQYGNLTERQFPSGIHLSYASDAITARSPTGKELGSIEFERTDEGHDRSVHIRASDGQELTYSIVQAAPSVRQINAIEPKGLPWTKYSYVGDFLGDYLDHDARRPTKIERPEGRYLELTYYSESGNDVDGTTYDYRPRRLKSKQIVAHPNVGRVKEIWAPVGKGGERTCVADFRYGYEFHNRGRAEHTSGWTKVFDAGGNWTDYHYDCGRRLTRLAHHAKDGSLLAMVGFTYNYEKPGRGNLVRKVAFDEKQRPLVVKTYEYDRRGNVVREHLWGNLTGECDEQLDLHFINMQHQMRHLPPSVRERVGHLVDCYTIHQRYPPDVDGYHNSFDNRIREREEFGRREVSAYLGETDLVTARLTYCGDTIARREFFKYDDDHFLCTKIIDDGEALEADDLSGVMVRLITRIEPRLEGPAIGFPARVEERYWDSEAQTEQLLSAVEYQYDERNLVTEERHFDALGSERFVIHKQYDEAGRLISQNDPSGGLYEWGYDACGNLTMERTPSATLHHSYDAADRRVRTDWEDRSHYYHYDSLNHCVREVDWLGRETKRRFDALGRLVWQEDPMGGRRLFSYDALGRCTQEVDELGGQTRRTFTSRGQPIEVTYPDGTSERHTYDLKGREVRFIDRQGRVHLKEYDPLDRLLRLEIQGGELSKVWSYTYKGDLLIEEIDPTGLVTTYEYDGAGRLICERSGESWTGYRYDAAGHQHETHHSGLSLSRRSYDLLDRVVEELCLEPDGVKVRRCSSYKYDAAGNQIFESDGSVVCERDYDRYHRPISIRDGAGETTIEYGPQTSMATDAEGRRTSELLDGLDRVVRTERFSRDGELVSQVAYQYDPLGNVILEDHDGFVIERQYDGGGRLKELAEPGDKVTAYDYDQYGRLACKVLPDGSTIEYAYDGLGRLLSEGSKSYGYDLGDRVIWATDGDSRVERDYDREGRLVRESQGERSLTYAYDGLGRQTLMTLPDGSSVAYLYDAADLREVRRLDRSGRQRYRHRFERYDLGGQLLQERLGCGHRYAASWDGAGRLSSYMGPHYEATLSYDGVSNLVSLEENGVERLFAYDARSQLLSEPSHNYGYDLRCNRTEFDGAVWRVNESDRLLSDASTTLDYDDLGHLRAYGRVRCCYDQWGRLISFQDGGARWEYGYDAFDRRVFKRGPDGEESYLWDGFEELGQFEGEDLTWVRLPGVAVERGSEIYFPVMGHRGDVVALFSSVGEVVGTYSYGAFGEEESSGLVTPWRFQDKRVDEESGLIYFGRRYYAPWWGRWTTPDPIGFEDGPNLYAYVSNAPWMVVDLYGENAFTICPGFSSPMFAQPDGKIQTLGRHGMVGVAHGFTNIGVGCFEMGDRLWAGTKGRLTGVPADTSALDRGWGQVHRGVDRFFGQTFGVNVDNEYYRAVPNGVSLGADLVALWVTGRGLSCKTMQFVDRLPLYASAASDWIFARGAALGAARSARAAEAVIAAPKAVATPGWAVPRINRVFGPSMEGNPYLGPHDFIYKEGAWRHLFSRKSKGYNAGFLERPFMRSTQFLEELMRARAPVPDKYVRGALRWDVPGSLNGRCGSWELSLHPEERYIIHYNFIGKK